MFKSLVVIDEKLVDNYFTYILENTLSLYKNMGNWFTKFKHNFKLEILDNLLILHYVGLKNVIQAMFAWKYISLRIFALLTKINF